MLARPERFFADRFGLNAGTMERLLGSTLAGASIAASRICAAMCDPSFFWDTTLMVR